MGDLKDLFSFAEVQGGGAVSKSSQSKWRVPLTEFEEQRKPMDVSSKAIITVVKVEGIVGSPEEQTKGMEERWDNWGQTSPHLIPTHQ